MSTRKQRALANPARLNAHARAHYGFPSARAMETALALAAKVKRGGTLGVEDVRAMAGHYPLVPQNVLMAYASRINNAPQSQRLAAFADSLGFGAADLAAVEHVVNNYEINEAAATIAGKAAAKAPPDTAIPADTVKRMQAQTADRADLREAIKAAAGVAPVAVPRYVYKHDLANRLEKNLHDRAVVAEGSTYLPARTRTDRMDDPEHLRDAVRLAVERDAMMSEAVELNELTPELDDGVELVERE